MGDTGIGAVDFERQLDLVDVASLHELPITVIGAGGIGSPTVLFLAKMGCRRITVYDHDIVAAHNVPNQIIYGPQHIGHAKVAALQSVIEFLTGTRITTHAVEWVDQPLRGVVISAVDDMDVRAKIWTHCEMNVRVPLFIDGRMGGQLYHIFAARPCDEESAAMYRSTLFPQSEAVELSCTARAIIYTATIGGEIAHLVKCAVMREPIPAFTCRDFVGRFMEFSGEVS